MQTTAPWYAGSQQFRKFYSTGKKIKMRKYWAWKVNTDSWKKKNDALFKEVLELKMHISSIKSNNENYTLVGDEKTEENSATLNDPLKSNQPSPKFQTIKPKVLLISTSNTKKLILNFYLHYQNKNPPKNWHIQT